MTYRPEIDGLRAVAVVAVLLYHSGFSLFAGGFVGVDVFFVISGYLITGHIIREHQVTGTFEFGRFYTRRIKRLFPALVCTIFFSFILAFVLLSPQRLSDFSQSAVFAISSLSNFLFWTQADYFDASSLSKPLLHTWSLSIEEQFYLVWPAFIVLVLAGATRARALLIVLALACASFLVAEYWLANHRDAAFYLLPARIFEFALGAVLVWLPRLPDRYKLTAEIGAIVGLGLIVWPVFAFDHGTAFPGAAALIPCLGAALFIAFSRAKFATMPLRLAPTVWIGKISYSLYLVHWPITVFASSVNQDDPNVITGVLIVFLSFVLGWLQYEFVEKRFRYGTLENNHTLQGATVFCGPVLAALCLVVWAQNGWHWRVPEHRLIVESNADIRREVVRRYCSSPAPENSFAGQHPEIISCSNYQGSRHNIYVWGDSHALHLVPGLSQVYDKYNVYVLHISGCPPQSGLGGYLHRYRVEAESKACADHNKRVLAALKDAEPAHIIVSSAKRGRPAEIASTNRQIVNELSRTSHELRFLADFIRPGKNLLDCVSVPALLIEDEDIKLRCMGDFAWAKRELRYNEKLGEKFPELIEIADLQCHELVCKYFHAGEPLYRDDHHLSIEGSVYFIKAARPRLSISTKGWNVRYREHKRKLAVQTALR